MEASVVPILQNQQGTRELPYALPEESPLTIKINGEELATLMCSRSKLTYLVVGFLRVQRVINSLSDIGCIRICDEDSVAEVTTLVPYNTEDFHKNRAITSGCTGGVMVLNDNLKPLDPADKTVIKSAQIFEFMKTLYRQSEGYLATGGMHSSALSLDGQHLQFHAEDIGRHNTIDKLAGMCAISGLTSKGGVMVTTGRISSEMVAKAVRMEVPILISRTSPTSLAVKLAEEMGITLVGYAKAGKSRIYTYPWRIQN